MSQGVGGHRAGQGAGREGRLRHPSDPRCCPQSKAAGDFFSAFIPVVPTVLVPIVTEQPGTAALGDIPGPQAGTEDPEAVPWGVPYPKTSVAHMSLGMAFLRFRTRQVFTVSLQPWKSKHELPAEGMAQPGRHGAAQDLVGACQGRGMAGGGGLFPGLVANARPRCPQQVVARWGSRGTLVRTPCRRSAGHLLWQSQVLPRMRRARAPAAACW